VFGSLSGNANGFVNGSRRDRRWHQWLRNLFGWGTVMLLRARDLQTFCTAASCNALTLANGWNQTWIVRYLFTRYLITVWRKPNISIVFYSWTQSDVVTFSATKHHAMSKYLALYNPNASYKTKQSDWFTEVHICPIVMWNNFNNRMG
jgi:hypothetical protein